MEQILSWWNRPQVSMVQEPKLTLREAVGFIGQSHRAIADDCEYLGIKLYPNKGGCLNRENVWQLVVFAGWKIWKWEQNNNWRGDRSDYLNDWDTPDQRYGFGPPRDVFDENFDQYLSLIGKEPTQFIGVSYAA